MVSLSDIAETLRGEREVEIWGKEVKEEMREERSEMINREEMGNGLAGEGRRRGLSFFFFLVQFVLTNAGAESFRPGFSFSALSELSQYGLSTCTCVG
jgi:hypothetical protein